MTSGKTYWISCYMFKKYSTAVYSCELCCITCSSFITAYRYLFRLNSPRNVTLHCVFLKTDIQMEDSPYRPPVILNSPSDIGCKPEVQALFGNIIRYLPLWSLWFSIELAELFNDVDYNANVITTTVNGIPAALPKTKLLLLCRQLRSLRDLCNTETGYFGGIVKEEVYTALIASWFQLFFGMVKFWV